MQKLSTILGALTGPKIFEKFESFVFTNRLLCVEKKIVGKREIDNQLISLAMIGMIGFLSTSIIL